MEGPDFCKRVKVRKGEIGEGGGRQGREKEKFVRSKRSKPEDGKWSFVTSSNYLGCRNSNFHNAFEFFMETGREMQF